MPSDDPLHCPQRQSEGAKSNKKSGSQNSVAGAISHDGGQGQKAVAGQKHHARMRAVRRCISQNLTVRTPGSDEPAFGIGHAMAVKVSRSGTGTGSHSSAFPIGPEDSGASQQSACARWIPPGGGPQASSTSTPPGSIRGGFDPWRVRSITESIRAGFYRAPATRSRAIVEPRASLHSMICGWDHNLCHY